MAINETRTHDAFRSAPVASSGNGIRNAFLWVVFGGLAGWLASIITGDDAGLGIVGNIIVGVIGAFLGGFIADQVGMGGADGAERPTSLRSFAWAVIGALILLFGLNIIM